MASEKALKTRQSILDAARKIIIEEGIDALSMDHVAQSAGISKGACMYHFKTKRALHLALIEDYADHLQTELARHEALFTGTPDETFVPGFVEWFKSFDADNHGWASFGISLLSRFTYDDELMAPVKNWYRRLYARIEILPEEKRVPTLMAVMTLEGFFYTHKFGLDLVDRKIKDGLWPFMTEEFLPTNAKRKPKRRGA